MIKNAKTLEIQKKIKFFLVLFFMCSSSVILYIHTDPIYKFINHIKNNYVDHGLPEQIDNDKIDCDKVNDENSISNVYSINSKPDENSTSTKQDINFQDIDMTQNLQNFDASVKPSAHTDDSIFNDISDEIFYLMSILALFTEPENSKLIIDVSEKQRNLILICVLHLLERTQSFIKPLAIKNVINKEYLKINDPTFIIDEFKIITKSIYFLLGLGFESIIDFIYKNNAKYVCEDLFSLLKLALKEITMSREKSLIENIKSLFDLIQRKIEEEENKSVFKITSFDEEYVCKNIYSLEIRDDINGMTISEFIESKYDIEFDNFTIDKKINSENCSENTDLEKEFSKVSDIISNLYSGEDSDIIPTKISNINDENDGNLNNDLSRDENIEFINKEKLYVNEAIVIFVSHKSKILSNDISGMILKSNGFAYYLSALIYCSAVDDSVYVANNFGNLYDLEAIVDCNDKNRNLPIENKPYDFVLMYERYKIPVN
ncbi:hypothetical protein DMUE_1647 [Dictyocoela muelleri]|nr:hypothetical protein DMUE_1647 [Dictyocoela muelleri]